MLFDVMMFLASRFLLPLTSFSLLQLRDVRSLVGKSSELRKPKFPLKVSV